MIKQAIVTPLWFLKEKEKKKKEKRRRDQQGIRRFSHKARQISSKDDIVSVSPPSSPPSGELFNHFLVHITTACLGITYRGQRKKWIERRNRTNIHWNGCGGFFSSFTKQVKTVTYFNILIYHWLQKNKFTTHLQIGQASRWTRRDTTPVQEGPNNTRAQKTDKTIFAQKHLPFRL